MLTALGGKGREKGNEDDGSKEEVHYYVSILSLFVLCS